MANRIKRNVGIDADSQNIGNWSVGLEGTAMGPTSVTGFRNGINPPAGGYTIYTDGVNVRTAGNDVELINILNKLGASLPEGDTALALQWAKDNGVLVVNKCFDNIVTDGLIFNVDGKHVASYIKNQATTNILSAGDPELNNSIAWTNSGQWSLSEDATDIAPPFTTGASGLKIMRGISVTTGSQHWGCAGFSGAANTTYTISVWFRQNRAGSSQPYFRTNVNNNSLGNFNYNGNTNSGTWPVNKWIRISCTATLQSNETGAYLSNYIGGAVGDIVWYYAPMVELGSQMSPFVHGSRSENSTWYDLSGNNRNAVKSGSPVFNQEGYWQFRNENGDGDFEYFRTNFNGGVLKAANTTSEWTIEATFRDMGSAYGSENIIAGRLGHHSGLLQKSSGGGVYAQIRTDAGGTGQIYIDGGATTDGVWTHSVLTYKDRTAKLYVNGELVGSQTMSSAYSIFGHNDDFYIGGMSNNMYRSYIDLSSVRVYSKELSQEEVRRNYFGGGIEGATRPRLVVDPANPKSFVEGDTVLSDMTYGDQFIIEGAGVKSNENNGILKLEGGRIYMASPGWYGKMAISWWMKMNGAPNGNFYTESYRGSGGCARIYSWLNGEGTFTFYIWDNSSYGAGMGGSFGTTTTTNVCDGQWHHITCQWSNGTGNKPRGIYVYVDGAQEGWTDCIGNDGSYAHLHLGGVTGCLGEITHHVDLGPIVQYTNYNLTDQEVYQNYSAYAARFK